MLLEAMNECSNLHLILFGIKKLFVRYGGKSGCIPRAYQHS
jgi:hypothetical protein